MFFRFNQKPDEVLPNTKIMHLIARGDPERKGEYVLNNTKLHEAVLANDDKTTHTLLLDERESKNINAISFMNTPLLLALKQGNTRIAKLILTMAKESEFKLDINHADARGLTALDWACMLRHDEVIKMILSWPDLVLPKNSYAKALYNQAVDANKFERFLKDMTRSNAMEIAENHGYPHLLIFSQEPYSDMIYFMRDICVNQSIMEAKDFPPPEGASHIWFYKCFKQGYQTFCVRRNETPVNQELLTAMLSQESLNEWKSHKTSQQLMTALR